MARKIGINQLTTVEAQGHSKERLQAQLVGTLPPVTKYDHLGIPYQVYPRDPNHPRWQKKEANKPKKTKPLNVERFKEILEDLAA